jgi:hypothetical protein
MIRSVRIVTTVSHHRLSRMPHFTLIEGEGRAPAEQGPARALVYGILGSAVIWSLLLTAVTKVV